MSSDSECTSQRNAVEVCRKSIRFKGGESKALPGYSSGHELHNGTENLVMRLRKIQGAPGKSEVETAWSSKYLESEIKGWYVREDSQGCRRRRGLLGRMHRDCDVTVTFFPNHSKVGSALNSRIHSCPLTVHCFSDMAFLQSAHSAHNLAVPQQLQNGGTILAVAGAGFSVIAGDTRQSDGYTMQARTAPKVFCL